MPEEDNRFHSLNKETGLLEGVEDLRRVTLRLANELTSLLSHPLIRAIMPLGVRIDEASLIVSSLSFIIPMSQADFLRSIAVLLGEDRAETEEDVKRLGLSETLPITHPDAPVRPLDLEPLDPNDPLVKESQVLAMAAEMERTALAKEEEEKVELPSSIESYLRGLMNKAEDSTQEREE